MEPEFKYPSLPFIRTSRQVRIYKRLNQLVGPGPAQFFDDACRLIAYQSTLPSTTHIVSHLLREIESALRTVVRPLKGISAIKNQTENKEKEKCRRKKNTHRKEILYILHALEIPQNDPVAIAWLGITRQNSTRGLKARAHRNSLALPRPFDSEFLQFLA